jgi:CBS domain-containing protein
MQARDVMTTRVTTVNPDTPVEQIAQKLLERCISAVPVVQTDGKLVGIVSEGDLMRRPESGTDRAPSWWLSLLLEPAERAARYLKSHGRRAADIMSSPVISVEETENLADIAEILEKHHIKRVPVLRNGEVVGIVSRSNLLQGLAAHKTRPLGETARSDQEIRSSILDHAHRDTGMSDEFINVTVTDGVVQLWGLIGSETERKAVHVLAENTPGVRRVEDNLRVGSAFVTA